MSPITTRSSITLPMPRPDRAGIDKRVSLHTLRHSFATPSLEQNLGSE